MNFSKILGLGALLALASAWPCRAEDVPFAMPPMPDPTQPKTSVASLGDIMGKIQSRHIKLWYAIKSKNWDLMAYEMDHLRDTFETAVILYRNIPVEFIVAADKPLIALEEAIKAKDGTRLEKSFGDLTTECNNCHRAAEIGFILIQTPTSSPFSNQQFAPKAK